MADGLKLGQHRNWQLETENRHLQNTVKHVFCCVLILWFWNALLFFMFAFSQLLLVFTRHLIRRANWSRTELSRVFNFHVKITRFTVLLIHMCFRWLLFSICVWNRLLHGKKFDISSMCNYEHLRFLTSSGINTVTHIFAQYLKATACPITACNTFIFLDQELISYGYSSYSCCCSSYRSDLFKKV